MTNCAAILALLGNAPSGLLAVRHGVMEVSSRFGDLVAVIGG
jgi:hypothetical protein